MNPRRLHSETSFSMDSIRAPADEPRRKKARKYSDGALSNPARLGGNQCVLSGRAGPSFPHRDDALCAAMRTALARQPLAVSKRTLRIQRISVAEGMAQEVHSARLYEMGDCPWPSDD